MISDRKVANGKHINLKFKEILDLKTLKVNWQCYRPRSRGDNTFGSIRPSICPSVSVRSYEFISTSIQNGWAFKMVVVSTGCAIAVNHAFNYFDWLGVLRSITLLILRSSHSLIVRGGKSGRDLQLSFEAT